MTDDDLVTFLSARLHDDETVIRKSWNRDGVTSERWHGTPFDPSRALSDVAAKRSIVDSYALTVRLRDEAGARIRVAIGGPHPPNASADDLCDWDRAAREASLLVDVVKALAQPYSGHPHFHPSWAIDD